MRAKICRDGSPPGTARTGNGVGGAERTTVNQRLAVFGLIERLTKSKTVATMPADEVKNAATPLS
jgi:hypothetical protein